VALVFLEPDVGDADFREAERRAELLDFGGEIGKVGARHGTSIIRVMSSPPEGLPTAVYSAAQVRALDQVGIEVFGIPAFELMTRAADAAFASLQRHWPDARELLVFCGAGNNGGDGYLVARRAREHGMNVRVVAVSDPRHLRGAAAEAWAACASAGVVILTWPTLLEDDVAPDVIVDALLGTGIDRDLDAVYTAAVTFINETRAPVLAIDIPSGLDADSGLVRGVAVRADVTITFVGLKQGLFLGSAPDFCGTLEFADLGIPTQTAVGIKPALRRLTAGDLVAALPPRSRTAHKGTHGRLLLVGGGPGMGGAIRLAAEGALRAGAGLVYVGTHSQNVATVMAGRPEIMCRGVERPSDLDAFLAVSDALVLGPGLGQSDWAEALWGALVLAEMPLVLDADGLNWLAKHPKERKHWVLTPHPGEAARLLGKLPAMIEQDRLGSANAIARKYGAITVLKGARSLIAEPIEANEIHISVCGYGNPGMATAGVGDVLAGVLGGLLAQLRDPGRAARIGVVLHALAGDAAAAEGERGLVASDLLPHIRRLANPA
jgi:NAD(P)H-hydrate epimerase